MNSAKPFDLESYLDADHRDSMRFKRKSLIQLMSLLMKHPRLFSLGILMMVLSTSAALFEPRIFGYAIDDAILVKNWDHLQGIGLVFIVNLLVRFLSTVQQSYCFEALGQRVTQELRVKLFTHLESLPLSTHQRYSPARLVTRVTHDIAAMGEMFSAGLVSMVCNFFLVIGILFWLIALDLRLGIIAMSAFPVLIIFSFYFSAKLRAAYRDSRGRLAALNSFLADHLLGMKVVHLFNRQKAQLDRYFRLNQWYAEAQVSSIRVYAFFQPTITIVSGVSIGLIIWFGGKSAMEGQIKLGVLVAYFSYLLSLFQPVREIADKWNTFVSGMTSAERIFSILDWPGEVSAQALSAPAVALSHLNGEIRFEKVWFAYRSENWVIQDLSFTVRPGERVALVGPTGSGKSTLIQLLQRMYEPQRGRILLDGRDLREYNLRSLRASMGYVQQDSFLFSGSVQDNLTLWSQASQAEVSEILERFHLNLSPSSRVSEKGLNLSLGERQVIALARVLMRDPKIWILDEATASVDGSTERLIHEALDEASLGKTTWIVAHRLKYLKTCDRILVMHQGRMIENGTHEELLARHGLYSRLYRLQEFENQRRSLS